jgi:hypothetical protein
MIAPKSLLAIAEEIAASIPHAADYTVERNASWLAIGQSWLKLDDFPTALRVLQKLDDRNSQAEFRAIAGMWAGNHPQSDAALALLRDTVEHIDFYEDALSRKQTSELVGPIFATLGAGAVHAMSGKLKDALTASNVLVTLAAYLPDPGARRETLRSAEELAKGTSDGHRDYALRCVINGYREAGFDEYEKRARALMSQALDLMNDSEYRLMADAARLLRPLAPPETDSASKRLRRFLDYGYNDLRVLFLTEACDAGGLDDPEAEQIVASEALLRIAPARPARIYTDPSTFDVDTLASFLFGRPKKQLDADRTLIDGHGDFEIGNPSRFFETVRDLFLRFGEVARRFPPEQVDQGLWYLLCEPFWLISHVGKVPAALLKDVTRAMYYPFRNYYLSVAECPESAFFMWWDLFSSGGHSPALDNTALEVLGRIIALPSKRCQEAALHGLNHLESPPAAAVIRQFLAANRGSMSPKEIDFAEACMRGGVQ